MPTASADVESAAPAAEALPSKTQQQRPAAAASLPAVPPHLLPAGAKALVFDCDGTLLDSMGTHYEAWKHTAGLFGIGITAAEMVELAGKPVHELLDIFAARSGVEVTPELRHNFFTTKSQYYLDHAREVKVIPEVVDIARAGAALGLPMAVASGGTRKHVIAGLTATGLLPLFGAIVCGEDVPHGKPAPDAFLLAAQQLGVEPGGCVGYEDAALGMQAIRNANYLAAIDVTQLPTYPHLMD
ncbi:Fructose-1-phosphate phosphatase YqaB [Tetrabaena socialis]|uniref:Fructose-1-phosphate phosphatase YqaB n=1 Tax=Tetrabaena socialis TaxID=47790 RepID=A0A2J7ZU04_9CHLO|nr:Fructose-1-phosphate phosphatase YqaB [Tetrabaena socialis]|eukprot:PNH03751.1 Fructose-1-phosphate phosphatase YqaB [Tetrabaena socialis]